MMPHDASLTPFAVWVGRRTVGRRGDMLSTIWVFAQDRTEILGWRWLTS